MAKVTKDLEVEAMSQVSVALEPLDDAQRKRVLIWAAARFNAGNLELGGAAGAAASHAKATPNGGADDAPVAAEEAAEFFSAASPESDMDKALVMGHWFQEVRGDGKFDAQSVNSQLKELGHRVGNITRAYDNLKAQKPQLVIQLQKTGTSKQGRKTYKVTDHGKKMVKAMLSRAQG